MRSPRGWLGAAVLVVIVVTLLTAVAEARTWAWLGVRIRDLSEMEMETLTQRHGIREGFGVVIVEVLEDTPAARAGLKNGDIVVALGDRPVVETRMLQRLIAATAIDLETPLTVLRPEGRRQVRVRLVTMPRPIAGERVAAEFGFVLRDPQAPDDPAAGRPSAGVPAVGVVARGSAADQGGLEVGDVILQVNEQPVVTRDAAREALADAPIERPLQLTVRRSESRLTLTLRMP